MILAGDIGGTKTLLALFGDDAPDPVFERRVASAEHADFDGLLAAFLEQARAFVPSQSRIEAAAFGVAGPVDAGRVHVTNLPWILDASALAARFDLGPIVLLNDFAAAARGIAALTPDQIVTLQTGEPRASAPRVLLGAGTGLGIAYLFSADRGFSIVESEGGHAGFAPCDARQAGLWRALYEQGGRVEVEHVLSGPGLVRIYDYLAQGGLGRESVPNQHPAPEEIVRAALADRDATALAALDVFIACFGAVAGDHALNVLARGGVYVAGGIAPKILPRLRVGGFMASFNDKGAFAAQTRRMPVHVVIEERLALLGAACRAFELKK